MSKGNKETNVEGQSYVEYVYEAFREHHDCLGLSEEEINDLVQETTFGEIEDWLTKIGYDLTEYKS